MKIFNWVHWKFNQNVDYYSVSHQKDGFGHNLKRTETVTNDNDTEALLDHVTLVLDGILTIGTFGFDPSYRQNGYSVDNNEEEIEEEEYSVTDEEDELNPLVVEDFKREFEKVSGSNPNTNVSKRDPITTTSTLLRLDSPELKSDSETNSDNNKKKRTTLADLFSADSNVSRKSDSGDFQPDFAKKPTYRTKHGLALAKRIMPRKGEDSRPFRKLHRLMTRMLKRKIHPELEGEIHATDGLIDVSKTETSNSGLEEGSTYDTSEDDGANESVSLLPGPCNTSGACSHQS